MGLLLLALVWVVGAALLLTVLFFVVRCAVEGGIRRALQDDVLRPSVRELVARRDSSV